MDKSGEKEYSSSDDEPKSFIQKVYLFIRSNWAALAFALLISVITIVVVPIVYSIKHNVGAGNVTNYSWNISGITIVNQSTIFNGHNQSLGVISALAFDSNSYLYLLDQTKNRILKFNMQMNLLILIAGSNNGTSGADINSFNSPNDMFIATFDLDKIYIADSFNHRIICFDQTTKTSKIIFGTGVMGNGTNQLNQPMSLTIQGTTNLYIADYGNNRIILFDLSTSTFVNVYLNQVNSDRSTYVLKPISIKSDLNSVVIAQQTGFNVIRWTNRSSNWELIAGSASSDLNGTSRTLFNQLCSCTIDMNGNTFVNDCYNQRVQFYLGDMSKGRTIAGVIQAKGNNSYIFDFPTAIALDSGFNLYVADSNNHRIQLFDSL